MTNYSKDQNKSEEKKPRRNRRTKVTLEQDIERAAKEVIEEVGFEKTTILAISQRAQMETSVFYKRYPDLESLFDKFVRTYDYWMNDIAHIDTKNNSGVENFQNLLLALVDSVNDNTIMQKLLIWELESDNRITRRTANNRELNSAEMLDYFMDQFKDCRADFRYIGSLFTAGIYYLILHKKRSTFSTIDFNKKESINGLKENLKYIIEKIYSVPDKDVDSPSQEMIKVIKNLDKNGVSCETIIKSTGYSKQVIKGILSKDS